MHRIISHVLSAVMLNGQPLHHENAEAHRSCLHEQAVQDWHRQEHGLAWSLLSNQGRDLSELPSFESDMGPWPQLEGSDHEALPDFEGQAPAAALPQLSSAFLPEDLPGKASQGDTCMQVTSQEAH